MACIIVKGGFDKIQEHLSHHLQRKRFEKLQPDDDLSNFFLLGHIKKKWPLQRHVKHGSLMKLTVQEGDGDQNKSDLIMNVFLMGDYAENCQLVGAGDVICLSNPIVEKYGGLDDTLCRCQLIFDGNRRKSSMWVGQKPSSIRMSPQPSASTNTTTQAAHIGRQYVYTKLADVRPNTIVNVFGVVKFFKPTARTKGTDYFMVLSITDSSMPDGEKLRCNLFARDPATLPTVHAIGDVIRIHRLKITEYASLPQGQTGPGFAWLLFDGKQNGSFVPKTNTTTYTITHEDRKMVEELRNWFHDNKDVVCDVPLRVETFSAMTPGGYYNITCQVVATCILEPSVTVLLRCWDGTQAQHPVTVFKASTEEDRLHVFQDDELVAKAKGYVYDVFVFDDHFNDGASVKVGEFVTFTNLHALRHKDPSEATDQPTTLELCLHKGTAYGRKLETVPDNSSKLTLLKERLEKVAAENDQLLSQWSSQETRELLSLCDNPLQKRSPQQSTSTGETAGNLNSNAPNSTRREKRRFGMAMEPGDQDMEQGASPRKSKATDKAVPKNRNRNLASAAPTRTLPTTTITTTEHCSMRVSCIKDILKQPAPNRFRLKARVQDYLPRAIKAEEVVRWHCNHCNYITSVSDALKGHFPTASSKTAKDNSSQVLLPKSVSETSTSYSCPTCLSKSPRKTRRTEVQEHPKLQALMMLQLSVTDDEGSWLALNLSGKEAV